jgi:hypothetical protein
MLYELPGCPVNALSAGNNGQWTICLHRHYMYPTDGAHLSFYFLGQLAAATLDIKASLEKIIENKILLYVRLYVSSGLYRTVNPSSFM